MTTDCPFCKIESDRILWQDDRVFIIYDGFPISQGHALIIPKRHIESFFDATTEERDALLAGLDTAKQVIENNYEPDSYNIGINDGQAAGQTVAHLHIHLIPRYEGDVMDPRGGVRWIMPEKADYWSSNT
jgi:diadenosine tetraphosphate (Ap4A) HIT family hydrolase